MWAQGLTWVGLCEQVVLCCELMTMLSQVDAQEDEEYETYEHIMPENSELRHGEAHEEG